MRVLSDSIISGLFLGVIAVAPLNAQTVTRAPADANATAVNKMPANTTPTGQAPDDVMKKISDLVHAGKYAEAQHLTSGLLAAYPDDQRLIKAKALLDKALASSKSADPAASSNPPGSDVVPAPLAANANAEPLTGMERVDYDALIELARQAQQNTDLGQQKKLLQQFMDRSASFVQKHPNEMLLWEVRAASAISLDDPIAGYEAGRRLLAADAVDSGDAHMHQLLAQLNLKGWLDEEKHQAIEREAQQATWTDPATGYIWTKQDNGSDVDWSQAKDYCSNLRLAGYATWQLPTTEELGAINDQVIKGGIKLSSKANLTWSSRVRNPSGEPCYFMFDQRGSHCATNRRFVRVLCIRRPAQ
ncbi:MAG: DUF1566 domain-containing protein [Acidobacteriia bacterium]|nr:DUF1566 domain-containing protein [Terriglobia bacterium]